jgi:nucleotide-binding universal stress UspA family protein
MELTGSEPGVASAVETRWGGKLQLSNVLCAVDLSEVSRRALRTAARISSHFGARLYVQHTFDLPEGTVRVPAGHSLRIEDLPAALQEQEIELRALVSGAGANAILLLNDGNARERILETIAGKNIDLLVMGTRARRALGRFLEPSLAERMVHQATCPSLILSLSAAGRVPKPRFDPLRLRTILVPTDFSLNAMRLLVYALRWASAPQSRVILFHSVPTAPRALGKLSDLLPEYDGGLEQRIRSAWEQMRALIPSPERFPCPVSYEVRDGDPKEQILKFAKEQRADLIVMGARILKGPGVTWGSTIAGVIRDGRFPVLAVRHLGE